MLTVMDVHKRYRSGDGPVRAVDGVSFKVAEGTMFGILGPSGCGKTTLLRSIAGLETPEGGDISIDGALVFSRGRKVNVAPDRREVSFVFQSYAIWPHLSVFENVAFPLQVRRVAAADIEAEVEQALVSVGLDMLRGRPATSLSGGQQQRLALARAFVARPRLLLLDEPLSNLDAKLRERMRVELKRMQREHGVTTVFVTHDQREGLSLADTVAVMDRGQLMQVGTPRQIYDTPANVQVAEFIGMMNLVRARPTERRNVLGHQLFSCAWGELAVRGDTLPTTDEVMLGIRPERLRMVAGEALGPNFFTGRAQSIMYYGDHQEVLVTFAGGTLTAFVPAKLDIVPDQTLVISVDAGDIRVLSRRGMTSEPVRILAA